MEKLGKIVQIRAPHGQIDAENTDYIFSDVLPPMLEPDADNIVFFEEAGVVNSEEARRMRKSAAASNSVTRARYELDLRRAGSSVHKNSYDVSCIGMLCDGAAHSSQDGRQYHRHDWLLEQHPRISLIVTPESYPEGIRKQVSRQASSFLADTVINARPSMIEELISIMEHQWRNCKKSKELRDPEIIREIERTFLVPAMRTGVKTKVMMVIGGYHDPVRHLSPSFAESFDVEDRKCERFANNDEAFLGLFDDGGSDRDALMRHILYFYLVNWLGEILAKDYKSTGSKKFKRDGEGKNVFGRLKGMCLGLPIEAIYKIFQSVLGIDCHMKRVAYGDIGVPAVFENFKSQSALCGFVESAEMGMEANDSKVNLFVERRFILHCLLAGFNVVNAEHRKTFEEIVGCLDDANVVQMATEIRRLFYREKEVGMRDKLTILLMLVLGEALPEGSWSAVEAYCKGSKERVRALRKTYRIGNFQGYCSLEKGKKLV